MRATNQSRYKNGNRTGPCELVATRKTRDLSHAQKMILLRFACQMGTIRPPSSDNWLAVDNQNFTKSKIKRRSNFEIIGRESKNFERAWKWPVKPLTCRPSSTVMTRPMKRLRILLLSTRMLARWGRACADDK